MLPYTVYHAGDTAVVLEFGETIDPLINQCILRLSVRLDALALEGVTETVPSFRSLLVQYDPCVLSSDYLLAAIKSLLLHDDEAPSPGRLWRLPICYDTCVAEDIRSLAERLGISERRLVEIHTSRIYSIYMLGFLPGQPYLGDLAPELHLPRRVDPRLRIPAGSVGVATSLTSIFPSETPCGWHLIGRTPVRLWRQPVGLGPLLAPGDRIAFEPISLAKFEELSQKADKGLLALAPEDVRAAA